MYLTPTVPCRQTAEPDRERPEGQGERLQPAQVDAAVLREEAGRLAAYAESRRTREGGTLCAQLGVPLHPRRRRAARAHERLARQVRVSHGQGGAKVRVVVDSSKGCAGWSN